MFEEAVYEADIGELVRAETHFGLHLIKVEAERQAADHFVLVQLANA